MRSDKSKYWFPRCLTSHANCFVLVMQKEKTCPYAIQYNKKMKQRYFVRLFQLNIY